MMKPQKPRAGLFGGLRNAFSQQGLAQTNNAGISRGEQLGAMLMSLAGPQQAMMAQQNLMNARQENRMMQQGMAAQQAQQQQELMQGKMDAQRRREEADRLGLQDRERALFLMSPDIWSEQTGRNMYRSRDPNSYDITPDGVNYMQDPQGDRQFALDQRQAEAGIANTLDQVRSRREGDALAQAEFDREANAAPWDDVNSLRGDAEGDLNRIRFREVESSFQRVVDSAREPSAAGDLALIFNYMKMLDPGSTVREGEFANAQNAGGASARARAAYNSILDGTRLTDEQRSDFLGRAEQLYQGQRQIAEQRLAPYQEQAQQRFGEQYQPYAVPQLLDVGGRGQGASRENPASMPAQVGAEYNRAYADLPSGAYYTHPDGTVRRKR